MRKQTLIFMLVLAALLVLPIAAHAQAIDPVAVVSGFLTDIDDPSKSITYLADDVHIQIFPPPGIGGTWDGKAGAQAYAQFSKDQDTKVQMLGNWLVTHDALVVVSSAAGALEMGKVNGDQVTGTVKVDVVDFRKLGVSPVEHTIQAVVQNGKIKSFTWIMPQKEQTRLGAAIAAVQQKTLPTAGASDPLNSLWLIGLGGLVLLGAGLALRRKRV